MEEDRKEKLDRILGIYTRLVGGAMIDKGKEARRYGVNERTIQRDIDDIRNFLELDAEDSGFINHVIYDRQKRGYCLESVYKLKLSNSEVLAICKILLDSRAFRKDEMESVLNKLIDCCVPKSNQKTVRELISNEAYHYVEPRHKERFTDRMWEIGQAIRSSRYIDITYQRRDMAIVNRRVKPAAIMFSEFYFYMAAFIEDEEVRKDFDVQNDTYPTLYRIDRVRSVQVSEETFRVPYSSRFEEGEFRKRIQFMYGGKLRKVEFTYTGNALESVLDRLPTARILWERDGEYRIAAEVFGIGIEMWIRSQGSLISDVVYK